MSTYTRKIGQNRGKPRLWLEGAILSENGFMYRDHHGYRVRWSITRSPPFLILAVDPEGTRRVAGDNERPIIDINSGALLAGLGPEVTITVVGFGRLQVENKA